MSSTPKNHESSIPAGVSSPTAADMAEDQSLLHGASEARGEGPGLGKSQLQPSEHTFIGHCYCRAVSWSVPSSAVAFTSLCHCKDCQIIGGSVLGQTSFQVYEVEKVSIEGRESVKEYKAESEQGSSTKRCFCDTCGTILWNHVNEGKDDQHYAIRMGGLVDDEMPEMQKEIFIKSKPKWLPHLVQDEKERYHAMP